MTICVSYLYQNIFFKITLKFIEVWSTNLKVKIIQILIGVILCVFISKNTTFLKVNIFQNNKGLLYPPNMNYRVYLLFMGEYWPILSIADKLTDGAGGEYREAQIYNILIVIINYNINIYIIHYIYILLYTSVVYPCTNRVYF